jgi:hypothetical protein
MQRLQITASIFATGRVWLPESSQRKGYVKDWCEGFLSQICSVPDSTHDDYVDSCVDSLTQIQMAGGTKAIKDVVVGDMVVTPEGLRKVTAVHDNGVKEVWDVNGLLATAEHRVMTQHGWTRVDALNQSIHNVYLYKGASWHSNPKAWLSSRLSSMVESTTVILRATTQRTADTLRGLVTGFTGMFGFITTGQSLKGCTSITLTATQATTTLPILLASHAKSIWTNTALNCQSETNPPSRLPTLTGCDTKPLNGTGQTRAGHGTKNTPRTLWARFGVNLTRTIQPLTNAFGAVLTALQKFLTERSFAAQPAKIKNLGFVLPSQVTNTHTMRHVFDLTVEGEHCYYANGILVHNCTQAIRLMKDMGFLDINPDLSYDDDDDYEYTRKERVNPYAQ